MKTKVRVENRSRSARIDLLFNGYLSRLSTTLSFPGFPSTSGTKPSELHVYTIEECQSCKQKTKRDFKVGDYIAADTGTCEKCQGKKMIVSIYGESPPKR